MRLKEDSSSWKSSGIKHRDNRHDKSFDGATGPRRKKKRREWCGGKEGKKHKLVYRENKRWSSYPWRKEPVMEIACEKCNKSFEIDYDWFSMFTKSGRLRKGKEKILEEWNKKLGL